MNREPPAWTRNHAFVAALLVLVTLLAGVPALVWGTFHFDDGHSLVENTSIRTLANVPRFFADAHLWSAEPGNAMYRPTLLVTYAVDYAVWGLNASGFLLTNVLVHGLVAALVYRLALRLGLSDVAALLAGAVMALHPVLSETFNYVSSRSESVAALAMLAALHLHLSGRAAQGARRVAWLAGAFALFTLSVLAKETTAGFCAAVFWLEILVDRGPAPRRVLRAAVYGLVYLAAFLVVFVLRKYLLGAGIADLHLVAAPAGADVQVGGGRSVLEQLMTQSRVVVLYYKEILFPVSLNVDHDVRILTSMEPTAWLALAIHATTWIWALVAALRGRRLLPLCVGWFWIFLAPSIVIPLNVVMNEHRLYLPMIAVSLLAGAALARWAERIGSRTGSPALGLAFAAAPLALFVPLHVQRAYEWRSDESLWTVAVARAPLSARAHMHLGAVWQEKGNESFVAADKVRLYDAALAQYAVSERLHSGWPDLQLNVGNAHIERGRVTHDPADFEEALAAYTRWGRIVGADRPRPRYLQALAHMELGHHAVAAEILRRLAEEDPSETTMYDLALARVHRKAGDRKSMREAMDRVIALEARDGRCDSLLDLAWWYFEDGDPDEAQRLIQRAIEFADARPPESFLFKPYLWALRFLVLTGNRSVAQERELFEKATRYHWAASPAELLWVAGGRTPGVVTGTLGRREPVTPR